MAENSKIEWTTHTWNPWIGCTKVAAGCVNCYAEVLMDQRYGKAQWGPNGTRVLTSPSNWAKPLKWNRDAERAGVRARVFCASLADVFEDWSGEVLTHDGQVARYTESWGPVWMGRDTDPEAHAARRLATMDDARSKLFKLIDATPHLDWLLLTKRPENIQRMWPRDDRESKALRVASQIAELREEWRPINGFPKYHVSNHGRVRGARGEILSPDVGDQGHCRVTLFRDGVRTRQLVHRIVLTAFAGEPADGDEGCHIDGDATNNALPNLHWGSQSSNWDDSKDHGTHRRYSKLTELQVDAIKASFSAGGTYAGLARQFGVSATQIRNIINGEQWSTQPRLRRLENCWLGTSIATQADADRNIPELLKCRDLSPVLFLSMEPLLGPVNITRIMDDGRFASPGIDGLDWVIVGGESGHGARPMHPDWARSIRDQCQAASVPFFFKQHGEWCPFSQIPDETLANVDLDSVSLQVIGEHSFHKLGKSAAGRMLDGRTWDEFPNVKQEQIQ